MKGITPLRESFDYTLWGYPIWYIKRKRLEMYSMVGVMLAGFFLIFAPLGMSPMGKNLVWGSTFITQWVLIGMGTMRHRLLKDLKSAPLRCDCGGNYVDAWDLGFYSDGYHLICDNDDVGDGWACEKYIVNPTIKSDSLRTKNK